MVMIWYSRNGDIAASVDVQTAVRLDNWMTTLRGRSQFWLPPEVTQFHDQLKLAVRSVPPEKR